MPKYHGPERRKLLNVRKAVDDSGTVGATEINRSMARMLGPHKLCRLNARLPERREFTHLRGLIEEIGCSAGKTYKKNLVEMTRGLDKRKLARIDAKVDAVFRPGVVLRLEEDDDASFLRLACAINIINPKQVRKYSEMVGNPKMFREHIKRLCGGARVE
jgi:hypothetical protein